LGGQLVERPDLEEGWRTLDLVDLLEISAAAELSRGDQVCDAGEFQLLTQFGCSQQRAERDEGRADPHHGRRGHRPIDSIRRHQSDSRGPSHPRTNETGGKLAAAVVELVVADAVVGGDDHCLVAVRRRVVPQSRTQRLNDH
jgi:hypothetical protein